MKQLILTKMWRPANSVPKFWPNYIWSGRGRMVSTLASHARGPGFESWAGQSFLLLLNTSKSDKKSGDQENKQISWLHFQLYSKGKDFNCKGTVDNTGRIKIYHVVRALSRWEMVGAIFHKPLPLHHGPFFAFSHVTTTHTKCPLFPTLRVYSCMGFPEG